jgi:hypothetical protein
MRQMITYTSVLLVFSLGLLAVWFYLKNTGQVIGPEPAPSTNHTAPDGQFAESPKNTALTPAAIYELPVCNTFMGGDRFCPCYFDFETKTLYPWQGVILHSDQVPNRGPNSRSKLLCAKDFNLIEVEAPVKYREVDGKFRVGFLDRSHQVFYEWKAVALRKEELLNNSKDGQDIVIKPEFDTQGNLKVTEIEMPDYLKKKSLLWKKM